ncbi:MAG: excalibur calcium-binding domain-containing protein [Actinobacteria bacterium]|nr:excalibur calcium-binding domain-containing protein [Actinomycetota bacterium]
MCSDWCTGRLMEQEYMGCPPGCRLIVQGQQTADGNVAGWHGPDVRYDDSTRSFTLPGGGSISSGARMEDAVFPQPPASAGGGSSSPTSSATVPEPDVISSPDVTTSAMGIMGTSGTLYSSLESYVLNESVVAITNSNVSVQVPAVNTDLDYVIFFDPAGSRPAYEVAQGSIESSGISAMSTNRSVARSVTVPRSKLSTGRGMLVVALRTDRGFLGWVSTTVQPPKKYSNCKALRKDYPSGVSRAADVVDKGKKANSTSPLPVVNPDVYAKNIRLDADKDGIACEV